MERKFAQEFFLQKATAKEVAQLSLRGSRTVWQKFVEYGSVCFKIQLARPDKNQ